MGIFNRAVDSIASKMAFFPPQPPSYEVLEHDDGSEELYINPLSGRGRKVLGCDVFTLHTKHGSDIVAAYIPTRRHSDPTLLYSHGNAVDLGQMLPFYKELAAELQCNIMGYDYSGYGTSTGTPSVANTLNDISACLDWLYAAGKSPSDIMLYGQSVGSGPTVYLAAVTEGIAGLILHSALASGMRVLNPNWKWWPAWLDVYPNTQLLPKVKSPVLIIHGVEDDVVHLTHGKMLHSLAKKPSEPLWAEGCDHQNVELSPLYLPRVRSFMEEVFGERFWKRYQ